MIRRLIILLLIVGCDLLQEEDACGVKGGDGYTSYGKKCEDIMFLKNIIALSDSINEIEKVDKLVYEDGRVKLNQELTKHSIIAKFSYYSITAGLMVLLFIAAT